MRPAPQDNSSLRLVIRVTPRAHCSAVLGFEGSLLRVKLRAAPVEGAANKALIELLADYFGLAKKNIKILRGEKSRIKEVEIQGLTATKAATAVLRPQKS